MSLLLDTSVLGRLANVDDPQHSTAVRALVNLHRLGEVDSITAQNLVEFRSAATRASNLNGLGLSIAGAEALATTFETEFPLLAETPAIFPAWKAIVTTLGVVGK